MRRKSIWRAKGRVQWALYNAPEKRQAIAELDHAYNLAVFWMAGDIGPEGPRPEIIDAAFGALGGTLRKWAHLGAMDTEPLANVRLALAASAEAIHRDGMDKRRTAARRREAS